MNYSISVLFRAIPLVMAAFCFGLGGFIFFGGGDPSRLTAGAVVFFLGSICIALYTTAATIIRQLIGTYRKPFTWLLPTLGYTVALFTLCFGIWIFAAHPTEAPLVVGGHVVSGLGLISICVSTAATSSIKFTLIPENSRKTDNTPHPNAYSRAIALSLEGIAIVTAAVAWIWAIVLLARAGGHPEYLTAGTVMAGIACICTSLIALVASITRQTRNTYNQSDKSNWYRVVLLLGTVALGWGLVIVLAFRESAFGPIGFIMIGLGLVCYSISSKVTLLAKVWRGEFPLARRIPLIPVLTALSCLMISAFLFEEAYLDSSFFIPPRVLAGLGAVCFTLFSIVSILESGTSGGASKPSGN